MTTAFVHPDRTDPASASASLAELSAAIGLIYECALDPAGWPPALNAIRAIVGGEAAWISVHFPMQVRSVYQIEVGTDPEWQRRLREHYVGASPFMGITHHVHAGDVLEVADAVDYEEFLAGRFYREWAAPQGWPDIIMGVVAKQPDRFSWLGICLAARATPEQKRLVALLQPHLERALRISDLLGMRATQSTELAAALEGLSTGMILIAADLGIRGINSAAESLIGSTRRLRIDAGVLRLGRSGPEGQLHDAIVASTEQRLDKAGASVLFAEIGGSTPFMAHVMPLPRPHLPQARRPVAALFLTHAAAIKRPPLDAFVEHYGLTPSETRTMLGILAGNSPKAIAASSGVGMPTVRTHLQRLFGKTGTATQADLVRMVNAVTRGP